MSGDGFKGYTFNIVRHRGDPTQATLESGDVVTKQDRVYFKDENGAWQLVGCADYHGEHFVYINPLADKVGPQWKGQWFAMCTCGSAAVVIDPSTARRTHDETAVASLLVCYYYTGQVIKHGVGKHTTGHRKWW